MKLTLLGTGHALVTRYYTTCFVLSEGECHLLVDGGGGSGILQQLEKANIKINDIHEVFVTHKHVDHILGVVWMLRMFCHGMKLGTYPGEAYIYGHEEVIRLLREMASSLLQAGEIVFFDKKVHFVEVVDGEQGILLGHPVTYFDINSTKAKQFGFTLEYEPGKKLTCCGDEPFAERARAYAQASEWLLHEAFNLYAENDIYHPYTMSHCSVKDAAETANSLQVKNLLIYHTEDDHIETRKELYTAEAQQYFPGKVWVPEDLEVIEL